MSEKFRQFRPGDSAGELSDAELLLAHSLVHSLWKDTEEVNRDIGEWSRESLREAHDAITDELKGRGLPDGRFGGELDGETVEEGRAALDVSLEILQEASEPEPEPFRLTDEMKAAMKEVRQAIVDERLPPMIAHRHKDGLLIRRAKPEEIDAAVAIDEIRQNDDESEHTGEGIHIMNPSFSVNLEDMR